MPASLSSFLMLASMARMRVRSSPDGAAAGAALAGDVGAGAGAGVGAGAGRGAAATGAIGATAGAGAEAGAEAWAWPLIARLKRSASMPARGATSIFGSVAAGACGMPLTAISDFFARRAVVKAPLQAARKDGANEERRQKQQPRLPKQLGHNLTPQNTVCARSVARHSSTLAHAIHATTKPTANAAATYQARLAMR